MLSARLNINDSNGFLKRLFAVVVVPVYLGEVPTGVDCQTLASKVQPQLSFLTVLLHPEIAGW